MTGHQVIYFGDHLPADIVECRRRSDWRTCLIVPEMREQREEDDISHLKQKLKHAVAGAWEGTSLFRYYITSLIIFIVS